MSEDFGSWAERVGLAARFDVTYVYTMYDENGVVLYIGITNDLDRRMKSHYRDKPWIGEVSRVAVERHESEAEARAREEELIKSIGTVYNTIHNGIVANVLAYFTSKLEDCPYEADAARRDVTYKMNATQEADEAEWQPQAERIEP